MHIGMLLVKILAENDEVTAGISGPYRPTTETPLKWCFAGESIVAGDCILIGMLLVKILAENDEVTAGISSEL